MRYHICNSLYYLQCELCSKSEKLFNLQIVHPINWMIIIKDFFNDLFHYPHLQHVEDNFTVLCQIMKILLDEVPLDKIFTNCSLRVKSNVWGNCINVKSVVIIHLNLQQPGYLSRNKCTPDETSDISSLYSRLNQKDLFKHLWTRMTCLPDQRIIYYIRLT